MTETYARDELERAAQETRKAAALTAILDDLTGGMTWTPEEIMEAGNKLGYVNSTAVMLKRAREMKSVTEIIGEARKPAIPPDDTVSYRELQEWEARIKKEHPWANITADEIMTDIVDHREPDYPAGTVVRGAKGDWWHRAKGRTWEAPGVSGHVSHDVPARPLKVWYHPGEGKS